MAESHLRSFIKGISWRFTGTCDTILIAFLITGQFSLALKIGAVEIVTKIILFYLHERLWQYIPWGKRLITQTISSGQNQNNSILQNSLKESHSRSLTKGVSWRITGTIDTIFISYIITGEVISAISIGSIEVFTKIFLYYLHERLWSKIHWGKKSINF